MSLQRIIDTINGKRVTLSPGISLDIDQGITLKPVIVQGPAAGDGVAIYFPEWPSLTIGFTPAAVKVWSILMSIAGNEPADIAGHLIDFHGQLPSIHPRPAINALRLKWLRSPVIDMRWIPDRFDPSIHYADLFADRLEIVGSFGMRSIPLGDA